MAIQNHMTDIGCVLVMQDETPKFASMSIFFSSGMFYYYFMII